MPATAENPPEVALDRKTQIAIPGGLHLLYNPEALDRWIPRKVEPCEGGGYKDNETGKGSVRTMKRTSCSTSKDFVTVTDSGK